MSISGLDVAFDGEEFSGTCGAEQLRKIPSATSYAPAIEHFRGVDNEALSGPVCRSFLHHMIRLAKPKVGLEIGTYKAGTTEVLAGAMQANGTGLLVTIDPFGADRVPPIMEQWPKSLQEYVSFSPSTSMDFFIALDGNPVEFDFVFVDGNHTYEFVTFDLNMSAKWLAPGGIIILDDYDQPGVFQAAKEFLAANPGWEEVGGVIDAFDSNDPFGSMRPSIPNTGFLLLAAPTHLLVTERPRSIEFDRLGEPAIRGFSLDLAPGNTAGTLHARVFWRSFAETKQEQLERTASVALTDGLRSIAVELPERLVTTFDPARSIRSAEIALYWRPDVPGKPLRLLAEPALLLE